MSLKTLWLAALLAIASFAAPPDAVDAEQVRKAAANATRELGVQQKLPNDSDVEEAGSKGGPQGWFSSGPEGPDVGIPAEIWGVVRWVMIAIVVVAVASWLATWASETWQGRQGIGFPGTSLQAGGRNGTAPLDPAHTLALADQWAADGRFGEAMHQVLLAAVVILAPRLAHTAPDSLTSWELLNAADLRAGERQALRGIVMRVDRAWFGKQPAGLEDYQAVRGNYQAFAAAGSATA